jgi:hypothetical protein
VEEEEEGRGENNGEWKEWIISYKRMFLIFLLGRKTRERKRKRKMEEEKWQEKVEKTKKLAITRHKLGTCCKRMS